MALDCAYYFLAEAEKKTNYTLKVNKVMWMMV